MSARYPILRDLATRPYDTGRECRDALTEIDMLRDEIRSLRRLNARLERDFAQMNPMMDREIREVTDRIASGQPLCGATWRDTEARGWLWDCSLPQGHDGAHRCIGASWPEDLVEP